MMYYINKKTHEVHTSECAYCPEEGNREYLGNFSTCKGAVSKAREKGYSNPDGCGHCSKECSKNNN